MKSRIKDCFNASEEEFSDWKWQYRNRITTVEELEKLILLSDTEKRDIKKALEVFPMAISPYYASLIDLTTRNVL